MSGFTEEEDIIPIQSDQLVVIESITHEEDGETGTLVLTREPTEEGALLERIFFIYEDKIGWLFSSTAEDQEMRETFDEMRTLLSSELPPEKLLLTFNNAEREEANQEASNEQEVGTRDNPLTVGERVTLNYYDWLHGQTHVEIELQELISGEEAWKLVREGNPFNEEPADGQEYILAKFHVKVLEVEEEPFDLHHALFDAVSSAGNTYDEFITVSGVEPSLRNEMYAGAEREGYTYFLVNQDDDPLAAFQRRSDAEVWFQLREE